MTKELYFSQSLTINLSTTFWSPYTSSFKKPAHWIETCNRNYYCV